MKTPTQIENAFRLKDVNITPSELSDIYEVCENEIALSKDTEEYYNVRSVYSAIYYYCLLENIGLTSDYVRITEEARNITKSNDVREMKNQFKNITKPSHIMPAILLKMLNNMKSFKFEAVNRYSADNFFRDLVTQKLSKQEEKWSKSNKAQLLRSNIIIQK